MGFEEVADLIVEGKNRQAYEKLRDDNPGMMTWDARARLIAARSKPSSQPHQTEAEIDARHDRAIYTFESEVRAKAAAAAMAARLGKRATP